MNMWETALAFLLGAATMWFVWVIDEIKKKERRGK